jgi:cardiolipin synthase
MSLPNLITILRILLVPLTVWLLISGAFTLAGVVFLVAGLSDAVDGFIARRFDLKTELGAYLDPIADKGLLVSIFVTLGILKVIPAWLVILVVTRDVLIVGGVILSWVVGKPMEVHPSMVSKVNTTAQIVFAGSVLAALHWSAANSPVLNYGVAVVAVLTTASGALYMRDWVRHMANGA